MTRLFQARFGMMDCQTPQGEIGNCPFLIQSSNRCIIGMNSKCSNKNRSWGGLIEVLYERWLIYARKAEICYSFSRVAEWFEVNSL